MEKLNYDVAKAFINTGTRINPKKHPNSWYFDTHSSLIFKINGYNIWCHYDSYNYTTTVHFSNPNTKIPFKISNAIYEKFKDEKEYEPIFEYDGGKSSNPSIPIVTGDDFVKAQNTIINQIFDNKRIAYLFPEEIAEKIVGFLKGTISNPVTADAFPGFNMITFTKNMQKFEKRKNLDVDSITLYTMEELEFAIELIRSTENPKTP